MRSLTRKDHTRHLDQITANLTQDQHPFWRWLKNIRGQQAQILNIYRGCDGTVLTTPTEKASFFNQHFSLIFTPENTSNLNELRRELDASWGHDAVSEITICQDEVQDLLSNLDTSKGCGPDDIPARLLKEGAPWLASSLTRLFNLSLSQGHLPRDWTSAKVTPIFKNGSKHSVANYRPISLTCIVVKTLERLFHNHLTNSLGDKLSHHQHGFQKGHSCQTLLLETVHEWAQNLDRASSTHVIFTDFSKAFDLVPHQRFLLKLESIGVRVKLLKWIESFLTNRRQRVLLDGCISEWTPVTSGVPQGSILGPLLFIIYVNDIPQTLSSPTHLFADDCAIYCKVSSQPDCQSLQEDLSRLSEWCQKWQLPLNTKKCKAMCITHKKKPPTFTYYINNNTLEWVDTFKYLGILDSRLKWQAQVEGTVLKASRVLNLLRRTMKDCSMDAKKKAYTALVRPLLEYTAPVWSPYLHRDIDMLEKVQKRAVRWVCRTSWDTQHQRWFLSYSDLCYELKWISLHDRHTLLCHYQTYKTVHGLDCIKFDNYFAFKGRALKHHPKSLTIPPSHINVYRHSYFVNAPFIWNQLPLEIILSLLPSLSVFKLCIKSMFSSINHLYYYHTFILSNFNSTPMYTCMLLCPTGEHVQGRLPFV